MIVIQVTNTWLFRPDEAKLSEQEKAVAAPLSLNGASIAVQFAYTIAMDMRLKHMLATILRCAVTLVAAAPGLWVLAGGCTPAAAEEATTAAIVLPGHPFSAISTDDGQAIFVSLSGPRLNGIAVVRPTESGWAVDRVVDTNNPVRGMALTHDGRILITAAGDNVVFYDVAKLLLRAPRPSMGWISEGDRSGPFYVAVSPDDRYAFVSDSTSNQITVIDLDKLRQAGPSTEDVVGRIPTAFDPLGLAFSPDGRTVYATCEWAPASYHWPRACKRPDDPTGPTVYYEGALFVIDVARAETDPASSVVARVPAGCTPDRVVLSPDGAKAYVSHLASDTVTVFDTSRLVTDPANAAAGEYPVGPVPVGLVVVDGGSRLLVANSNQYAKDETESTITILDTTQPAGPSAVVGSVPAGLFPRELGMLPDGTITVTNSESSTLEFISFGP